MSLIACIKRKSQIMQETILWTNPNPTSSFATQTVTLSDNITNYKYIKIEGKLNLNDSMPLEVYVRPEYLITCVTNASTKGASCSFGGSTGTGATGARYERMLRVNESNLNKIIFGSALAIGTGSSTSTEKIIPLTIIGIK